MITLTKNAIESLKKIIEEQTEVDKDKVHLRVGVKGGGCSGFSYVLDLTDSVNEETDEIFDHEGVKVAVDQKSLLYLDGTTIDYKDAVMGKGFTFDNPNATHKCGCGSSFDA
jgi:iron-sulfur cluster assembly protein